MFDNLQKNMPTILIGIYNYYSDIFPDDCQIKYYRQKAHFLYYYDFIDNFSFYGNLSGDFDLKSMK